MTALLEGPAGPIAVASVHDETFLLPLSARLDQAAAIFDDVEARYPVRPSVVAGDFNCVEPEAVSATVALAREHGFARAAPGDGEATADGPLGDVTLDLVFARGLSIEASGVSASRGASDHRVVWAALR